MLKTHPPKELKVRKNPCLQAQTISVSVTPEEKKLNDIQYTELKNLSHVQDDQNM